MKRILVTGKNSYIGNQFEEWVNQYKDHYMIDKISVRDLEWKDTDFSAYDTILHLAGIAHVSRDPKMEELYYKVNCDLTIELAKKAKSEGVKQFIFLSSIIVYGESSTTEKVINRNTVPIPSNFYGNSKLQAERKINELVDDNFKIAIIRPPMIYGKGSKGNYPKLAKAALKVPFFPDIENERSMLHIDNLCEFIRIIINNKEEGLFFPQNNQYTKTSELVRLIGEAHGKQVKLTKVFNPLIKPLIGRVEILNKLFGNLKYDHEISGYKDDYIVKSFVDSIKHTEH
ncbi:NAD-dependent epimerase/dehydratase family protein [Halalkalibacter flavus]|uniref:NAD-dependent epimerase/dehydratase family protein n=1 Tax=Halalkalibacter flavus TaxID=3090668 RepID=UPI002FC62B7F